MSVLTYSQIVALIFDRIQGGDPAGTDPPFTTTETARHVNDAYADIWEISGGAIKRVASATAWATSPTSGTSGINTSLLTDIGEIKEVFSSTTLASTGDVAAGDKRLDPVDASEILWYRENQTHIGSYNHPVMYSVTRNYTTTVADVNKLQLDVWPGVSGIYLPVHYVPQFAEIDSATVTTPAVNDIESRDIALLAASRMAPLIGRNELVPGILADLSQRTAEALERKISALMYGRADKRA